MKLKHLELQIPENNPFANCKLDRERYANILTEIVSGYADGFVLAINNKWGAGKTTFLKMWQQDLKNNGYDTLYYNAWENDFETDVLVALIAELEDLKNSEFSPKVENAYKDVVLKAAILTKKIGPGIIKTAFKKYTGLDSEELFEVIKGTSEVALETLKAEIESYSNRKKGLKDFKISLEKLVKEASDNKPVVFFIDELDRCRPNYSVEVLEVVKHLFSVPGIVFVLSIDKEQLGHAVRGVYGSDKINATEYLRRFIDVEFNLPYPNYEKSVNYLFDYYELKDFFVDRDRSFIYDERDFKSYAIQLLFVANLNFRQQEKLFSHIKLSLFVFAKNEEIFPGALVFLIYLRLFEVKLYSQITEKKLSHQRLFEEFEKILPDNFNLRKGEILLSAFLLIIDLYNNSIGKNSIVTQIGEGNFTINLKSKLYPEEDITRVMVKLQDKYWYEKNALDSFIYKIELLEPLKK